MGVARALLYSWLYHSTSTSVLTTLFIHLKNVVNLLLTGAIKWWSGSSSGEVQPVEYAVRLEMAEVATVWLGSVFLFILSALCAIASKLLFVFWGEKGCFPELFRRESSDYQKFILQSCSQLTER